VKWPRVSAARDTARPVHAVALLSISSLDLFEFCLKLPRNSSRQSLPFGRKIRQN
jgi:hypothetical protein